MGQIMRARPVTTTIALGILVCGATVGLEATGVLFHAGAEDSKQRTEALLARLETDLDSMVAPSAPVDLPSESEQEPPWQEPDRVAAAEPARDAAEGPAEGLLEGGPDARSGNRLAVAPDGRIDGGSQPDSTSEADASPVPVVRPIQEATAVAAVMQPAINAVEREPATPPLARLARPDRPKSARLATARSASTGCPVLDWLSQ
jgi:hypothetical protein